jgi:hypothetical protein
MCARDAYLPTAGFHEYLIDGHGRSVPVLEGFRAFEQNRVRRGVGNWAVLDTGPDDKDVAGPERDRVRASHLDAEGAVPTQEELVLFVVMPGELAVESGNSNHGIVDPDGIGRLPRSRQAGDEVGEGHGAIVHVASVAPGPGMSP